MCRLLILLLSVIFLPAALSQTFAQLCAQGFGLLQFSTANYARYDEYFSDTSVFVLAEAGEYVGPDDIAEYVQYADQNSPFIKESSQPTLNVVFRSVDEAAGTCEFLATALAYFEMNEEFSVGATLTVATLSRFVYNLADNKIERFHIFYKTDFLQFWFGELLGGERTRTFVCDVFEGCEDTKALNEDFLEGSSCMTELGKLPLLSEGGTVDGKDQGCRILHSVFAEENPHHCPHISFVPEVDDTGNSRCQESKGIKPTDLFEDSDFDVFEMFLETAFDNDADREQGYNLAYLEGVGASSDVIGAFFSCTNTAAGDPLHPRGNQLYMYHQMADGKLAGPVGTFDTGDAGILLPSNQGSIHVSGDQVFVANGSMNSTGLVRNEGSVSVFTFTKYGLKRTDNVPSGGPNPASLAICNNILYVANGAYIGGPVIGEPFGYIAHPTISSTLTGLKVEDDGTLTYIDALTQDLGVGARAADIQLSPDNKYLLVVMTAGELRAYKVGSNCMLTGSFMSNNDVDIALGAVALSPVEFDGKTYVYVGNLANGKVVAFLIDEDNQSLSFINSAVGPSEGGAAALCWSVIYGTYLYTSNAVTNTISSFKLDPATGGIETLEEVSANTGVITFPTDMYIEDGRLYQLLAGNGYILVYDIADDGSLWHLQTFDGDLPGGTPAAFVPPELVNHPNVGPLGRPLGLAFGSFKATKYIEYLGNNRIPSGAYPLGECQGDCDGVDEDYEGRLICFHRDGGEAVPGCLGGEDDNSRTDYCVS